MLRPSAKKGPVRGRLINERKFVTKDAIPYSRTGWRNRGVEGEAQFIVTGHHDPDRQAVEPVHLDRKAGLTREGKDRYTDSTARHRDLPDHLGHVI